MDLTGSVLKHSGLLEVQAEEAVQNFHCLPLALDNLEEMADVVDQQVAGPEIPLNLTVVSALEVLLDHLEDLEEVLELVASKCLQVPVEMDAVAAALVESMKSVATVESMVSVPKLAVPVQRDS